MSGHAWRRTVSILPIESGRVTDVRPVPAKTYCGGGGRHARAHVSSACPLSRRTSTAPPRHAATARPVRPHRSQGLPNACAPGAMSRGVRRAALTLPIFVTEVGIVTLIKSAQSRKDPCARSARHAHVSQARQGLSSIPGRLHSGLQATRPSGCALSIYGLVCLVLPCLALSCLGLPRLATLYATCSARVAVDLFSVGTDSAGSATSCAAALPPSAVHT
ncbi:hypothetical protein OAO87_02680 [bacterium]|nr:hypothetical protein [bacterium]